MYPFGFGDTFPKNQWYIAAHSNELERVLLERRILDELMVMFRTESGSAVIMDGLCPHRLYPLSKSKLVGDTIVCGYHGFAFDSEGNCVNAPSQENIPKSFCTKIYPVIEKPPYVWVWTGNPDLADESLVPNYDALNMGDGFVKHTYATVSLKARYQLLIENLFDLTHLNFIHGMTVDLGTLFDVDAKQRSDGNYLGVFRVVREAPIAPFNYFQFGEARLRALPEQKIDLEVLTEMYNPGLIVSGNKAWKANMHGREDGYIGTVRFLHGVTPETETTTHYFSGFSRDVCADDEHYTVEMEKMDRKVRSEDVEALEAIESRISLDRSRSREISVFSDRGGLRARTMIKNLIANESH